MARSFIMTVHRCFAPLNMTCHRVRQVNQIVWENRKGGETLLRLHHLMYSG
jgi:hypothetical protein